MALVDVVVFCRGQGRFLADALQSVVFQSVADLNVLVVGPAGREGEAAVPAVLLDDPRVTVVASDQPLACAASLECKAKSSSAPYVFALQANRMLTPDALARAVAILEQRQDVAFAYGSHVDIAADTEPPEPTAAADRPAWRIESGEAFIEHVCEGRRSAIATSPALIRRSALAMAGRSLPKNDDLALRLALAMRGAVAETEATQTFRLRRHVAATTENPDDEILRTLTDHETTFASFFDAEGAKLRQASRLRRLARLRVAQQAYWHAYGQRVRGEPRTSAPLLRLAQKLHPAAASPWPVASVPDRATFLLAAAWRRFFPEHRP